MSAEPTLSKPSIPLLNILMQQPQLVHNARNEEDFALLRYLRQLLI